MRRKLAVLLFAVLGLRAQEAPGARSPGPRTGVSPAKLLPPGYILSDPQLRTVEMGALSLEERKPGRPGLHQAGVLRRLPERGMESGVTVTLPSGRHAWKVAVHSAGARGIRVHFRDFSVGGGQVWIYALPADDPDHLRIVGPYSGRGIHEDGSFWSATVRAATVIVEYDQGTAGPAFPPFQMDVISHHWFAERLGGATTAEDTVAQCEMDVSCYPADSNAAAASVQYDFIADDGSAYVCSGAMIVTQSSSFIPYMLTAHHCISSGSEASTVEAHFFYQTPSCNGPPPDINSVPTILGASYLGGAPFEQGDYALLLLSAAAPAGSYFLGWRASGVNIGDPVVGIHHPRGSYTRISFGSRGPDQDTLIEGSLAPASLFYQIPWTTGITEPGSSGSPLINGDSQIVGTLTAGPVPRPGVSACDINPYVSVYGRFGSAFLAFQAFLQDVPPPNLTVNPTSLNFTQSNGIITSAAQQNLSIQTNSASPISFTAQAGDAWVNLSATSGSVSSSTPVMLTVSVNPVQFTRPGQYSSSITVGAGTATPVSVAVTLTVSVSQSQVVASVNPNPVLQNTPNAQGYAWFFTVTLTETAGVQTQLTGMTLFGKDYSNQVTNFFGTNTIPAGGSISASLGAKIANPPETDSFVFSGSDTGTGVPWAVQQNITFLAPLGHAVLALTSFPTIVRQDPSSANCPWLQRIVLQEEGGVGVTLNKFLAAGTDLSSQIGQYFSSVRIPSGGSAQADLCWNNVSVPDSLSVEVDGLDTKGNAVRANVSSNFTGPSANPSPLAVSPGSLSLASQDATSVASGQLSINIGTNLSWNATIVFNQPPTSWLIVYPLSGIGSTTINLLANPLGLATGSYQATILLQSVNAKPQIVSLPVTFEVGPITSPQFGANGLVNGASFASGGIVAGEIATIFGSNLTSSIGINLTSSLPLPTIFLDDSVIINGVPVPLFAVDSVNGQQQFNFQVPWEVASGPTATVAVSNNGTTSATISVPVLAAQPGTFVYNVGGNIFGAILHANFQLADTANPAVAGETVLIYCTGLGVVSLPPADGAASSGQPTLATPSVTIGGVSAIVNFSGLAPGFVGLYQINAVVPAGLAGGNQPVVITMGGFSSNSALLPTR